jgi:hypothetical protein
LNAPRRLRSRIAGGLQNAALLLLVVFLLPLAILVIGAPVVLVVRALLELVRRF